MAFALGAPNLFALVTPTLAGGSWLAGAPLTNLNTRSRADKARSSDALTTSTLLTIDWGSAKTARALSILGHNLSSAATVRWKRGTTLSGTDVYDSTAVNAWRFAPTTYDGDHWHVTIVAPSAAAARYERIEIADTGNAAGYVELARLMICDLFVPEGDADMGARLPDRDLSTKERTESGTPVVIDRPVLSGLVATLGDLTPAEARTLRSLRTWAGTTREVWVSPDIEDMEVTQADGFVGTFDDLSPIERASYARRGVPVAFTRD